MDAKFSGNGYFRKKKKIWLTLRSVRLRRVRPRAVLANFGFADIIAENPFQMTKYLK